MGHHVCMVEPRPQPSHARFRYGIDAPYVPLILGLVAVACLIVGAVTAAVWPIVIGVIFAVQTAVFLNATLRGKFRVWEEVFDDLALRGDEELVDLGCGRGAVLLAAARRLPDGHAHGVDLWRSVDQSGNHEEVTTANAVAEGVADRVVLHTADLTTLPFNEATFDVVTSSLAIHNISDRSARETAVAEALRVLRPGGHLVIADIRNAREYAAHLRTLDAADVNVRGLGPNFWFAGPWQAVSAVTATKH